MNTEVLETNFGETEDFSLTKNFGLTSDFGLSKNFDAGGGGGGGGDPYFDNVVLLLNFVGVDGATTTTDEKGHTITMFDSTLSADHPQFAGGVALKCVDAFPSSLRVDNAADLHITTEDFCYEAWLWQPSGAADDAFIGRYISILGAPVYFYIRGVHDYAIAESYDAAIAVVSNVAPMASLTNQWVHYAYVRNGDTFSVYQNGVNIGDVVYAPALTTNTANPLLYMLPSVGNYQGPTRLTIGVPRYTANFTPPTDLFPTSSGDDPAPPPTPGDLYYNSVMFLSHFDGTNGSTAFVDQKGHTITQVGAAVLSTTGPKFGTASLDCPTYDDGVVIDSDDIALPEAGTPFTLEFWAKAVIPDGIEWDYGQYFRIAADDADTEDFTLYLIIGGGLSLKTPGTSIDTDDGVVADDTWTFYTITRDASNEYTLYVNGVAIETTASAVNGSSTPKLYIGPGDDPDVQPGLTMKVDDLRYTDGVCRYVSDFTPPAIAFYNNLP